MDICHRLLQKVKRVIFSDSSGFSLLELLITLGIFSILMVTVTAILVINLNVARKIKGRTYAREETAFVLNILKKDIRNAEFIEEDSGKLRVVVIDEGGNSRTYEWSHDGDDIVREETIPDTRVTYRTPEDVDFESFNFTVTENENNWLVRISVTAWSAGMPGQPLEDGGSCSNTEQQCITKEVAIATRNFEEL
ncbi:prepilin-type N-terminal cleavage/methylation domain-containing protein [Candidatus Dojkabacteria bacterium]|nr:prepilin-type N-terminal cleavage/methylation domain-containing protein [Candidatus Dojkabacteria bacterium]